MARRGLGRTWLVSRLCFRRFKPLIGYPEFNFRVFIRKIISHKISLKINPPQSYSSSSATYTLFLSLLFHDEMLVWCFSAGKSRTNSYLKG